MVTVRGSTIRFKSIPEMWEKEQDGRKPNTVRDMDFGEIPEELLFEPDRLTHIQIENAETGAFFVRELTDISFFEGIFVFSWEHRAGHP